MKEQIPPLRWNRETFTLKAGVPCFVRKQRCLVNFYKLMRHFKLCVDRERVFLHSLGREKMQFEIAEVCSGSRERERERRYGQKEIIDRAYFHFHLLAWWSVHGEVLTFVQRYRNLKISVLQKAVRDMIVKTKKNVIKHQKENKTTSEKLKMVELFKMARSLVFQTGTVEISGGKK